MTFSHRSWSAHVNSPDWDNGPSCPPPGGEPSTDPRQQPAAVAERMAVGLPNGRPDRRANMREEQMRTDVPGELAQVLVIPGRLDAAEDPGDRCGVIPADAEPVPVGRLAPSREPSSGRSAN